MSKHLLLVSLGPVQDFIAAARRCQDLWYGSWLLGELSRATAAAIQQELKCPDLVITPAFQNLESDEAPEVANKILAVIPEGMEPQAIAEKGKQKMMAHLKEIATKEFRKIQQIEKPGNQYFKYDLALKQIEELMEYFWVAKELNDDSDNTFVYSRSEIEKALAARKNTRDFRKIPWTEGDGIYKSSLDGARESVIDREAYETLPEQELYERYHVRQTEHLCGIGLLKRLGTTHQSGDKRRPHFHSTAHMAAMPILECWSKFPQADKALNEYGCFLQRAETEVLKIYSAPQNWPNNIAYSLGQFQERRGKEWSWRGYGYDGYVLYEDRLPDIVKPGVTDLEELRSYLRNFLQKIKVSTPNSYYAFLLADGDRIGQAISAQTNIQNQRRMGSLLDNFSNDCRKIVERNCGSLIYAGGDDVMAMLPLHKALRCSKELSDNFNQKMASSGLIFRGNPPTLSIGLALSHFLEPLKNVRDLAKKAESIAKDKTGRNALAIIMSKRGGADIEADGKWSEQPSNLYDRIQKWQELLKKKIISISVANALEKMLEPFEAGRLGSENEANFSSIILSLAKQVLSRRLKKDEASQLNEEIDRRFDGQGKQYPIQEIRAISNEIQIAYLIHQAAKQAEPPEYSNSDQEMKQGE